MTHCLINTLLIYIADKERQSSKEVQRAEASEIENKSLREWERHSFGGLVTFFSCGPGRALLVVGSEGKKVGPGSQASDSLMPLLS